MADLDITLSKMQASAMNEEWKTIPGYSRYQASNLGRLRSTNYKCSGKTKILKPAIDQGYYKTMLQKDGGGYKTSRVHRWVALAWIGPPGSGMVVNHINGVKTDNRVENLEYVTIQENCQHAYDNGLQIPLKGSEKPNTTLTEAQVFEIKEYINKNRPNYGRAALAMRYGVSEHVIKDIVRGRSWCHV